jgi:hypothetical protein
LLHDFDLRGRLAAPGLYTVQEEVIKAPERSPRRAQDTQRPTRVVIESRKT